MNNIIEQLEQQIRDDLTPIDREERFRQCLDELYSPIRIGNLEFDASRIVEQMDETAFRCGVNDYADGEPWVEVNGDTYEQEQCEEIKSRLEDDLKSRVSDLEAEIGDEEGDGAPEHQEELAELNENLRLLKAHSF